VRRFLFQSCVVAAMIISAAPLVFRKGAVQSQGSRAKYSKGEKFAEFYHSIQCGDDYDERNKEARYPTFKCTEEEIEIVRGVLLDLDENDANLAHWSPFSRDKWLKMLSSPGLGWRKWIHPDAPAKQIWVAICPEDHRNRYRGSIVFKVRIGF
jgi:hypothetical protein